MNVKWISTRSAETPPIGFGEAMLRGLAPDGGLYVPTAVPPIDKGPAGTFGAFAARMLRPWLRGSFDGDEAERAVVGALDFPVPVVRLRDDVHVVELFHGPTLSFKDFGARTMARLMDLALRGTGQRRTVFVATSGDTGSAVADGFASREGLRVVLLYPEGQVSSIQERQIAAPRDGVLAVRVGGSFDDCQRMVKAVFADERFARYGPTSANSINVGRLVPQMTYHAWASARVPDAVLVVPSGNLGNLTAAVMARLAGVRVRRLVAAHNANHAFPDFLRGGPAPEGASVRTISNAMDVGTPSNFERLRAMLGDDGLRREITAAWVSDDDTARAIGRAHAESGYVADPHTGVGLEVVRRLEQEGVDGPFLIMSTAHPAKFPDTVEEATGVRIDEPPALSALPPVPASIPSCEPAMDALAAILAERLPGVSG